jgi:hypothetical protein
MTSDSLPALPAGLLRATTCCAKESSANAKGLMTNEPCVKKFNTTGQRKTDHSGDTA